MPNSTTNYAFNLPLVNDPIDADLWGGQLNSNWTSIDSLLKTASDNATAALALIDLGDIKITSRSTAPSKWLFCRGQAISRTTYSALFAAIGTTYGVGDGSTTFNVPDIQGRVIAGQEASATRLTSAVSGIDGATLGAAGGSEAMQQHTHTATVTDPGHGHNILNGTPGASLATNLVVSAGGASTSGVVLNATTGITVSNANTGTGTSQNVQPTIVLNYLIYAGV
ncbi:MAG: phage tail protein [Opitutia bacterium]|jgi:microcystin-dependent protein